VDAQLVAAGLAEEVGAALPFFSGQNDLMEPSLESKSTSKKGLRI